MPTYRSDLPERPPRMALLPLDERGYPVPWFVAWIDGKPDFRVVRENGLALAHNHKLCWLCGKKRGVYSAFVVGPMCGVNRVSSEPPSHRECAEYAVRACPFLTRPLATRNERGLDPEFEAAGVMIKRNPGVTLLWITKTYRPFRAGETGDPQAREGVLFQLGEPHEVVFYAHGRIAKREEIEASVVSGFPLLEECAQRQGPPAVRELTRMRRQFDELLGRACAA